MTLHKHTHTTFAPASINAEIVPERSEKFYERFEHLQRMYSVDLHSKLDCIIADWNQLHQYWQQPLLQRIYRHVHNLAGSGATFGFVKLGEIARKLTILLKPALTSDRPLEDALCHHVSGLLVQLCVAAGFQDSSPHEGLALLVNCLTTGEVCAKRTLFIVDYESTFVRDIVNQLRRSGYDVEIVPITLIGDLHVM